MLGGRPAGRPAGICGAAAPGLAAWPAPAPAPGIPGIGFYP